MHATIIVYLSFRLTEIKTMVVHTAGVFNDVHFGNHFALEGTSRKKSEICKYEIAIPCLDIFAKNVMRERLFLGTLYNCAPNYVFNHVYIGFFWT